MATPKIKFHSVNIYVSDIDRALFYYRRLGFKVDDIDAGYNFITIKLSEESDFVIYLKDAYAYDRKNGEIAIGVRADDEQGLTHEDVFLDLLYRGFVYSNMEPSSMDGYTICNLGVLKDPDGATLELEDINDPV